MIRVGQGIDTHPFDESRPMVLGGVEIDSSEGLAGHSDGDAVLHALADALLGAAVAGDIGDYFPSTDEKWRGASSKLFVEEALRRVRRDQGVLSNVDITVIAEHPRLAPHRRAMRESIAAILDLDLGRVSVKATTTDHLGFIGRGEGLTAVAIVAVDFPV